MSQQYHNNSSVESLEDMDKTVNADKDMEEESDRSVEEEQPLPTFGVALPGFEV